MAGVKRTVLEAVVLAVLGAALGLGSNAVRGSGRIELAKPYFAKEVADRPAERNVDELPNRADPRQGAKSSGGHPKHEYQVASFEDVAEIIADPNTECGLNVFIDARRAAEYCEGHIPGAIRCFPFTLHECLDEVMERTAGAERVISYCNGHDCEDSIFMCRELIEAGVPYENVYLYEGGWKEWTSKGQPIEKGP